MPLPSEVSLDLARYLADVVVPALQRHARLRLPRACRLHAWGYFPHVTIEPHPCVLRLTLLRASLFLLFRAEMHRSRRQVGRGVSALLHHRLHMHQASPLDLHSGPCIRALAGRGTTVIVRLIKRFMHQLYQNKLN